MTAWPVVVSYFPFCGPPPSPPRLEDEEVTKPLASASVFWRRRPEPEPVFLPVPSSWTLPSVHGL